MADFKKLALKLARAESEKKVAEIIDSDPLLSDKQNWAPYGNEDKNWDRVGNNQSSPAAALTEKITNSIDAVLTKECLKKGINPESKNAPQSMRDAVRDFFKIHDGKLGNTDSEKLNDLADNIQIIVTGDKQTPCYIIIDNGEGQEPHMIPQTFVSLSKTNKERINFVQGKFNMGGAGVLPYCGNSFYELIISKRNKEIVSVSEKSKWGFTLVRRRDPRKTEALPVVEYFIVGGKTGDIASFHADSLPLLPSDKTTKAELYCNALDCGTFIKLYDYKMPPGDRNVDFGLANALCRTLFMSCLPMWLKDSRVQEGHTWVRRFAGTDVRLENEDQEYILKLSGGEPSASLTIANIGSVQWRAIPLTRHVPWLGKDSVIYMMNGQAHAYESNDFLEKAGLSWLKRRLIVTVDCTEIKKEVRYLIFMPDRERMSGRPESVTLRRELLQQLIKNPMLKELNRKLREEAAINVAKDETHVEDLFGELVKDDPNLADLFDLGGKILSLMGDKGDIKKEFKGRKFPTVLEAFKGIDDNGIVKIPVSGSHTIKAKTDAQNDYLMRVRQPGKVVWEPVDFFPSCQLYNGIAEFKVRVSPTAEVGSTINAHLGFMDIEKVQPLSFSFVIKVEAENKRENGSKSGKKRNGGEKPKKKDALSEESAKKLPKIYEVWKDDSNWKQFEMDEKSGLEIRKKPDSESIDIFINMSNMYFNQYLLRYKRMSIGEVIKKQYKIGMAAVGCSLWKKLKKDESCDEIISRTSSAISQVILSVIRNLGQIDSSMLQTPEVEEELVE